MALCEFCLLSETDLTIGEYGVCEACLEAHPRVVTGLDFEINHFPERYRSPSDGLHWYSFPGIFDTVHIQRLHAEESLETYRDQFKQTVRKLGIKPSLTHLLLHHYIGELVVHDRGPQKGDVGVPPRTVEYGLCLAASVSPAETYAPELVTEAERLGRLSEMRVSIEKDSEQRLHFPELSELLGSLRMIYQTATASYGTPAPETPEYEAVAASRESELIRGQIAYPDQYIDGMERWYVPYQYEFLQELEIDMSKSVGWARELLELFYQRRARLLQQIRWYQTDCFRRLTTSREFVGGQTDTEMPEDSHRSQLIRRELESWILLVSSAERYLWIGEETLVNLIAPQNPYRFQQFVDRISADVGEYTVTAPTGFNLFEKYPLIRKEGEYLVPTPVHFARSLANTFYYDLCEIEGDDNHTENLAYATGKLDDLTIDLGNVRGDVAERWVSDYLYRIFNESQLWEDVESDCLDQIDHLAIVNDTAVIFEVKSKPLTRAALAGDLGKLYEDIEKGIEGATRQIRDRISQLADGPSTGVASRFPAFDHFLPIVVVGAPYDRFSTTAYPALVDEDLPTPYVVSVYDLDILTRLLDAEAFVDYVEGRIAENHAGQMRSMDEMDYLGLYLEGARGIGESVFSDCWGSGGDSEDVTLLAPIHGADQIVRQRLPDLERQVHLQFLTEAERRDVSLEELRVENDPFEK